MAFFRKLFGGGGDAPAPPAPPPPVRIPRADDADLVLGRMRKMREEFAQRDGRAATDLTPSGSMQPYSRTSLG